MIVFTSGPLQSLRLSLQILHTVDKEAEMIDFHQILTVLSRLVFEGCVRNFINYHIWLVTSPDSIIAQCLQTSLSRAFASGGDGWNSGYGRELFVGLCSLGFTSVLLDHSQHSFGFGFRIWNPPNINCICWVSEKGEVWYVSCAWLEKGFK